MTKLTELMKLVDAETDREYGVLYVLWSAAAFRKQVLSYRSFTCITPPVVPSTNLRRFFQ